MTAPLEEIMSTTQASSALLARAHEVLATGDPKQMLGLALTEIWSQGHWVPLAELLYHEDMVLHAINRPGPSRHGREQVRPAASARADPRGSAPQARDVLPARHRALERA
jgi:hypothetical protein